eukprot:scaffold26870_cov59-Phaeocystis_antarctica.AAC.3
MGGCVGWWWVERWVDRQTRQTRQTRQPAHQADRQARARRAGRQGRGDVSSRDLPRGVRPHAHAAPPLLVGRAPMRSSTSRRAAVGCCRVFPHGEHPPTPAEDDDDELCAMFDESSELSVRSFCPGSISGTG